MITVTGDVPRTANEKTLGDFLVAHHRHISPRLAEAEKLLVFRQVVPSAEMLESGKANDYGHLMVERVARKPPPGLAV